jgi:hypothetical protein
MYAVAFVGFPATVLYPLVTGTRDSDTSLTISSSTASTGLAFAGGLLFGTSVLRARVFPKWMTFALIAAGPRPYPDMPGRGDRSDTGVERADDRPLTTGTPDGDAGFT